jgi:hypothetical protein
MSPPDPLTPVPFPTRSRPTRERGATARTAVEEPTARDKRAYSPSPGGRERVGEGDRG